MTTFLLVHGAMHGGWCWRDVVPLLRQSGHPVSTPTLTGQGERIHLLSPDVGIHTHVADVVAVAEFEDLVDIVLVLHSYAGVLAGPLAERLHSRLAGVVAVGAFLIEPGESLLDVEPSDVADRYRDVAVREGDGWRIPASEAFLDQWAVNDPVLRAFVGPRLTDFPLRCATESVAFDPRPLASLPRTYVEHTAPPLPSLALSLQRAKAAGWRHRTIASGHDLMLTDPEGAARLLLEAAGDSPAGTLDDRDRPAPRGG